MRNYPLRRVLAVEDCRHLEVEIRELFCLTEQEFVYVPSCIDHFRISTTIDPDVMSKILSIFDPKTIKNIEFLHRTSIYDPKLIVQPNTLLNEQENE